MAISQHEGPHQRPRGLQVVTCALIKPAASGTLTDAAPKGTAPESTASERTALSCYDQTMARSAVGRALGYPGQRIEAAALEAALQATLADLPFLAGRLGGIKWKLGTLAVVHTDGGAVLSVADAKDVTVAAAMAPAGWTQRGIAVASPAWPSYLEPMEVGGSMMSGKEPLLKVRLTKLSDGDILGVTYCHALFCGHRWPAFMAHLAERYREALGGSPADPAALLRPNDRTLFSAQHMATQLLGKGSSWEPPKERLLFSLAGLFGLLRLVHANAKEQRDLLLLHLPHSQVQALKAVAAKGNSDLVISTGDVVQATAGLVMHAALGLPLLPVEPKGMHVVMQMPAPAGYFGNSHSMLKVSLPAGTAQPADGDGVAAVQALAGAIRGAIAAFRSNPEEALTTLAHTQLMTEAPLRTLTHLARHLLPHIQSVTNYVPKQEGAGLLQGEPPAFDREFTFPVAGKMAVIRPVVPPYSNGLFVQLCLTPKQAMRLEGSGLLAQLLPEASFVGGA